MFETVPPKRGPMFEIGWSEILIIVVVALVVIGPKDLPRVLRTAGQMLGRVRRMAGEFQSTFNQALREAERQAEIDDLKKKLAEANSLDLMGTKPAATPMSDPDPQAGTAPVLDPNAPVEPPAIAPVDVVPFDSIGQPVPSGEALSLADAAGGPPAASEPAHRIATPPAPPPEDHPPLPAPSIQAPSTESGVEAAKPAVAPTPSAGSLS
ncbi:sec-independent protein translocase protein TatB [Pseudoxanthobacter soli DSM 19599]|uniref:Sec-independent protein translocase protein TatB n=2 Tax=Pseudoxanthobacter TaxID=433838 RepID=A0A1M7Z783_9HYPH|nr:sec-independent protein translocase protein TatB [Pseudoxanthobacter soli DSM 19599]